jgi:hypothetical protein
VLAEVVSLVDVVVVTDEGALTLAEDARAVLSAARVSGPTMPIASMPAAAWYAFTAASVCAPKYPVTPAGIAYPCAMRKDWRAVTWGPCAPMLRVVVMSGAEDAGAATLGAGGAVPAMAARVRGPTTPMASMPWAVWYASTASLVTVPKYPVSVGYV